jgi:UDP-glucose 4-epimerase
MNIGAGNRITINRLAELMGGPVEYIPGRKETLHSEASNQKARLLIGWEPSVTVEEGVAEVLRDWGFAAA